MTSDLRRELREIPARAGECLARHAPLRLPAGLPALGMGSSYYAALAVRYAGADLWPEPAAEFYAYALPGRRLPLALLISQSGRSSETLWCLDRCERAIVITNDPRSPLATHGAVKSVLALEAGPELGSASKTYLNTLVALYAGFGIDPAPDVARLDESLRWGEERGAALAEFLLRALQAKARGVLVVGAGPSVATARQAALVLSECAKYPFQGLALGDYDHGPKEAAAGSAVVLIRTAGRSERRQEVLETTLRQAGAEVFALPVPAFSEALAPLPGILPFTVAAALLAERLAVGPTFAVGGKITEAVKE